MQRAGRSWRELPCKGVAGWPLTPEQRLRRFCGRSVYPAHSLPRQPISMMDQALARIARPGHGAAAGAAVLRRAQPGAGPAADATTARDGRTRSTCCLIHGSACPGLAANAAGGTLRACTTRPAMGIATTTAEHARARARCARGCRGRARCWRCFAGAGRRVPGRCITARVPTARRSTAAARQATKAAGGSVAMVLARAPRGLHPGALHCAG